jgi:hypothetical protein
MKWWLRQGWKGWLMGVALAAGCQSYRGATISAVPAGPLPVTYVYSQASPEGRLLAVVDVPPPRWANRSQQKNVLASLTSSQAAEDIRTALGEQSGPPSSSPPVLAPPAGLEQIEQPPEVVALARAFPEKRDEDPQRHNQKWQTGQATASDVGSPPSAKIDDSQFAVPSLQSLPTPGSPYHHTADYREICGQLQFGTKGWRLRYAELDVEDRYGGSVTLTEYGKLDRFQDGQFVRVRGCILDPARTIAPPYQLDSIEALD